MTRRLIASALFFLLILVSKTEAVPTTISSPSLIPRTAQLDAIEADLSHILAQANLPKSWIHILRTKNHSSNKNRVTFECTQEKRTLKVHAPDAEWGATLYKGLRNLGFLFPHPRVQISPKPDEILKHCGETVEWKPRLRHRGFHLHLQHPTEWVHGFLMGKEKIAMDYLRWSARNGQNIVQIVLLREPKFKTLVNHLRKPFELGHALGLHLGVSASFALQQQHSLRLLTPLQSTTGWGARKQIRKKLSHWIQSIDFDFITLEVGTSELTPTDYGQTLEWLNIAGEVALDSKRPLFIKVHVSSNQKDEKYGNFNFLPQYASPSVGVLPHTVMFYGFDDPYTPMYGRKNFNDIWSFMIQEAPKRPTWYFPETSYFIAMDIDVPLLLTDYLKARSHDIDRIESAKIDGILTFTTGQELGYWLFDWTTALLIDADHSNNPWIALQLLGEHIPTWKKITEFQSQYFKSRQLIAMLSSTNLFDELPWVGEPIHRRHLLKKLKDKPSLAASEASQLELALSHLPKTSSIKNPELKLLMDVTFLRLKHAHRLRIALANGHLSEVGQKALAEAKGFRLSALKKVSQVIENYERYPEAKIFAKQENPTSYSWGYGWPAATLHYWKREEEMVRKNIYRPTFMNIFEALPFLFSD